MKCTCVDGHICDGNRGHNAAECPNNCPVHAPGMCFPNAAMLVIEGQLENCFLVHGRPTLTRPPFTKFAHAWVELGGMVIDPQKVHLGQPAMCCEKERYYRLGKIDPAECHRYDPRETFINCERSGHWGPWDGPEAVPDLPPL